eukprot:CAMPEP_0198599582 /NCGR_PEP_ID=MMETSP1462-20131121/147103_1 /TAXON_ID=1333877 /ORGANISM="Brandtodinium nutriculum, Strain RCC3387" /LENGTH=35 /DNA_ID= /DNA_START= /DNA_END= /DNA_ORIENTATION=
MTSNCTLAPYSAAFCATIKLSPRIDSEPPTAKYIG